MAQRRIKQEPVKFHRGQKVTWQTFGNIAHHKNIISFKRAFGDGPFIVHRVLGWPGRYMKDASHPQHLEIKTLRGRIIRDSRDQPPTTWSGSWFEAVPA